MSPRVYERKFDWDEARRLRDEERLSFRVIAEHLGVTVHAVRLAYYPKERAANAARAAKWQRGGRCVDCGAQNSRTGGRGPYRCLDCSARAQAKVENGRAFCPTCVEWKLLAEFSRSRRKGRPVHGECRKCDNARRQQFPVVHAAECLDRACVQCDRPLGWRHSRDCSYTRARVAA